MKWIGTMSWSWIWVASDLVGVRIDSCLAPKIYWNNVRENSLLWMLLRHSDTLAGKFMARSVNVRVSRGILHQDRLFSEVNQIQWIKMEHRVGSDYSKARGRVGMIGEWKRRANGKVIPRDPFEKRGREQPIERRDIFSQSYTSWWKTRVSIKAKPRILPIKTQPHSFRRSQVQLSSLPFIRTPHRPRKELSPVNSNNGTPSSLSSLFPIHIHHTGTMGLNWSSN